MDTESKRKFKLFEAFGVELEYMIVDRDSLDVRPITDKLFHALTGEYTDEVERGPVTLNNELALHVLEFKTAVPAPALSILPQSFVSEVQVINERLTSMNAMLMPSAMHPWMDAEKELALWPHDNSAIYKKFQEIFDCRSPGWANLQSAHLNLPFGDELEFVRLHAAIRVLLPLIPALAASSPLANGVVTGLKDFRMHTYRTNARKIASITGKLIPEAVSSYDGYHKIILEQIYRDLEPHDPEGVLRYEWVNARGAITRFDRNAIEIRVTDVQECPLMDCAIAWAIASVLKLLCEERWAPISKLNALSCEELLEVMCATQTQAEDTPISNPGLLKVLGWTTASQPTAQNLWNHLLASCPPPPKELAEGLTILTSHGTLATRILKSVDASPTRQQLIQTYRQLCGCLERGVPFLP